VTIEQLGSVGELVGAIATIGTLWYLAIQIRQSSRTDRAANFVQIMSDGQVIWDSIVESDEIADIYLRGLVSFGQLSETERIRFHMIFSKHFSNAQLAFRLHQEGALDAELYEDTMGSMLTFAENPGVLEWWATARKWFHPDFASFVDSQFDQAAA
jgi:hypothetical protein